ncbi:MAG TPA: GAF domain-containing sensor histidine kinase [Candidatus Limnocylindrales bacterium]|nr:GAF domain-containing sensor histidine kinase [Candidatus Limnocylindrales bacterium]
MRVAVGLAFGAFGILLELGLDQVVGVAPWLVVAFAAVLLAAILGGAVGGVLAAAVGIAGQLTAIPAWVPGIRGADGASWPLEVATALAGIGAGLVIRRLILDDRAPAALPVEPDRGGVTSAGRFAATRPTGRGTNASRTDRATSVPRLVEPAMPELAIVFAAIRDVAAARTAIQVADALARHGSAIAGGAGVTVYLRDLAGGGDVGAPIGRSGPPDPEAPAQIRVEAVERPAGFAPGPDDDGVRLVPIAVGAAGRTRAVGVLRIRATDGAGPVSPLLPIVVQLAAEALERVRLDGAHRVAVDDAAGAGRRLAILGRLALELVGGRTIDEVVARLLDFAVDDLAAGFAAVHVVDEATGAFELAGARGYPAGLVASQQTIASDAVSPVAQAASTREVVEVPDEDRWRAMFPRASNIPAIAGVRAISALPMEARGIVYGVLSIGWRTPADRSAGDGGILAATAAQGAQALERAILHAHDEDARRFQEAFIGVVSHELRTPITTILAGSRLLKRRVEHNAAAADLTDDIVIEADRLTRIVDDLLVLSRLERRHLTIGDDPVHLDHLLARVVQSEAARWPSHAFERPASPNRHVVLGDETYVEQVLRNLISNAAKYSPAGSTIRIAIDDAPTGDVEVRVLDQGPGVAPGEVENLFSLFYRSPTTAASAAGAGIGLFVSRQLVLEMGGHVWARPRPEGGSEFGFSLGSYPIDGPDDDEDDDGTQTGAIGSAEAR